MNWWARGVYEALVWQERRRARRVKAREAGGRAHLETGRRGERLAYWHLRQAGYTVVARNQRLRPGEGELDMVAWDGPVLAFVEVKTRSSGEAGPPEIAVGPEQRRRILESAQAYLRRIPSREVCYRFDIASVTWAPDAGYQVRLIKDAFRDRP